MPHLAVQVMCVQLCPTLLHPADSSGSMEFSRQEYRSELPLPMPGELPDPGIEPSSLVSLELTGRFFTTVSPESP